LYRVTLPLLLSRRKINMPYLAGLLTGVLLTVLAVFVIDHVKAKDDTSASAQKIVNWDVAAQRLRSSLGTIKQEVHEATR
jgi:hypothetical protein